jgi:hypothetical protein
LYKLLQVAGIYSHYGMCTAMQTQDGYIVGTILNGAMHSFIISSTCPQVKWLNCVVGMLKDAACWAWAAARARKLCFLFSLSSSAFLFRPELAKPSTSSVSLHHQIQINRTYFLPQGSLEEVAPFDNLAPASVAAGVGVVVVVVVVVVDERILPFP